MAFLNALRSKRHARQRDTVDPALADVNPLDREPFRSGSRPGPETAPVNGASQNRRRLTRLWPDNVNCGRRR